MYENTDQDKKKTIKEDPLRAAILASAVGAGGTATYDTLSEVPHSSYDIAKRALIGGAISGLLRYGSIKYLDPMMKRSADVEMPFKKNISYDHMPFNSNKNVINKAQAKAITEAMSSAAGHGALKDVRVTLNGGSLDDNERIINNPRNGWLTKMMTFPNPEGKGKRSIINDPGGDFYHPLTHEVAVPSGNPGVLVHELGHAVDFNEYPNTPIRSLMAGAYTRAPFTTLWKEHAAWNKGRDRFLEGSANKKIDPNLALSTLEQIDRARPMGLGSYWGGGIGLLGGATLGAAIGGPPGAAIGGGLGGVLGSGLGISLGKGHGDREYLGSNEAKKGYLDEYVESYARKHNLTKEVAFKQLSSRLKPKTRSAVMNKSASGAYKMHKLFFKSAYTPSTGAMTGALAGAGIGGLGNAVFGNKKKSLLNRILTGGAVGGGLGGGLGYFTGDNGTAKPSAKPSNVTEDSASPQGASPQGPTPQGPTTQGPTPQSPTPVPKNYNSIEESQKDVLTQDVANLMKENPNIPPYVRKSLEGTNPTEAAWTANRNANNVSMQEYLKRNINTINQGKADAASKVQANIKNQASGQLYNDVTAKNFPRYIDPSLYSGIPENTPPVIPPFLGRYDKSNQDLHSLLAQFNERNPFTDSMGAAYPPASRGGSVPRIGSLTTENDPALAAMLRLNAERPLR